MKATSLKNITNKALVSFKRFPFAIILALLASVTSIYLIESHNELENYKIVNFVLASIVSFPFFISMTLFTESFLKNTIIKYTVNLIPVVFLVLYTLWLPKTNNYNEYYIIITIAFTLIFHLLVAFVLFTKKGEQKSFWQFNSILFQRFLTSALFSAVLYAGLFIAIISLDYLFDLEINGDIYGELWVVIVGIFSTWFFLSGVPTNIKNLETIDNYPKGLKIFTQFVLLPIVTIYLFILYAYITKIIVQWEWPVGWVSYLVLGFSSTGIFSLLLIYPIQIKKKNKFVYIFSKWFYFAIFPLIVLLFLAISVRIDEYGITENRYFVMSLALWLGLVSIYLLVNKQKNIKIIPISLSIITLFSIIGPFSAFNVSKNSQLNRLTTLLEGNNLILNGKIIENDTVLDFDISKNISSKFTYLIDMHGHNSVQQFFTENLDSIFNDSVRHFGKASDLMALKKLKYVSEWDNRAQKNKTYYFNIAKNNTQNTRDISEYQYHINFDEYYNGYSKDKKRIKIKNNLYLESNNGILFNIILNENDTTYSFNVKDFYKRLIKYENNNYNISQEKLIFKTHNDSMNFTLIYNKISLSNDSILTVIDINADIYLGIKYIKGSQLNFASLLYITILFNSKFRIRN